MVFQVDPRVEAAEAVGEEAGSFCGLENIYY